jgi:hypothetical protein
MDCILEFQNEYRFLSNFFPSPFIYECVSYATVEHFYQAQKTLNMLERFQIVNASSPAAAKNLGKECELREDWLDIREQIMLQGLIEKFQQNEDLRKQLIDTYPLYLIEGNRWGDTFWGYDLNRGFGDNVLGHKLMTLRYNLIHNKRF